MPAGLPSAVRPETAASQDERSLSIPMAAVLFPGRIRQRQTAPPLMPRDMWQKISSLRELTRKEGIFAGSSSGTALAAAKKFALAANNKPPRRSFMLRRGGLLRGMQMQFGDLCGVGIHLLSCGHLRLWSIKAKRCFMFRFPDPARRYTGRTGTTSSDSG